MKLCIHRGTHQIGGTCIEVEAQGQRVVLDLGLPLDADDAHTLLLPALAGLIGPSESSLLGIVLTHGHRDHWGLAPLVNSSVPIILGADTERMMAAAAPFMPSGYSPTAAKHLIDRQPMEIGPFRITPYLIDHSGYDAYSLLVEADGKRLFYTADLRGHGRKASLFERLIAQPPENVDLMLMEGSTLGRLGFDAHFQTEAALEDDFVAAMKATNGIVLVACSAQNIDRVVTVFRASRRSGRTLLLDAYAAEVLMSTQRDSIPMPTSSWPDVKVFIPQRQRIMMARKGIGSIADRYRGNRVFPENIRGREPTLTMIVRPWMLGELKKLGSLVGASVVWSQWEGYLADGPGQAFRTECSELGIPFSSLHTSGHSSIPDLQRLAKAIAPRVLGAVHTFFPEQFSSLFNNVLPMVDGQWVEV